MLDRLPDFAERLHVLERHGRVTGYAGVWRNPDHAVVGPVIADDTDDAIALIVGLARETDGPLRLDLDGRHPQLRAWATQHGVTEWFTTDVMVHDGRPLPGDRERWFVPLMQALG
ncbi:hypothetical protein GCM10027294_25080 [Marinactinospora endophytica]